MTSQTQSETILSRAREAQQKWWTRDLHDRLRVIGRLRPHLVDEMDRVVEAVDRHKDRGPGETLSAEILPVLEACRYLQKRAPDILQTRRPARYAFLSPFIGLRQEVRREPHGVILIIAPSNYPFMLPAVQALHALIAGNAAVIKPGMGGEEACRLLGQMLEQSGLPGDLYQVTGEEPQCGHNLLAQGPDKVVFTGSLQVGRGILSDLGDQVTPAVAELSGCDAVFVLQGADLDLVVRALRFGLTLNNGATCISPRRLFVTAPEADELVERLRNAGAQFPRCPVPEGPGKLARELIDKAVEDGASLLTPALEPGRNCPPTLVNDVSPEMRLLQEDIFAPVLSIVRVRNKLEALRADARCPYALGATVFGPEREAHAFAKRVNAGAVVVNDMIAPTADPRMPFGGRKKSGYGVTRGAEGLLEMTRPKAIAISRSAAKPHLDGPSDRTRDIIQSYIHAAHGRGLTGRLRSAVELVKKLIGSR